MFIRLTKCYRSLTGSLLCFFESQQPNLTFSNQHYFCALNYSFAFRLLSFLQLYFYAHLSVAVCKSLKVVDQVLVLVPLWLQSVLTCSVRDPGLKESLRVLDGCRKRRLINQAMSVLCLSLGFLSVSVVLLNGGHLLRCVIMDARSAMRPCYILPMFFIFFLLFPP